MYPAVSHIELVTHFRNEHGNVFELLSFIVTALSIPAWFLSFSLDAGSVRVDTRLLGG